MTPRSSTRPRLEPAVSGESARAVASLEPGAMMRLAPEPRAVLEPRSQPGHACGPWASQDRRAASGFAALGPDSPSICVRIQIGGATVSISALFIAWLHSVEPLG